jgi:hypothetical protein
MLGIALPGEHYQMLDSVTARLKRIREQLT